MLVDGYHFIAARAPVWLVGAGAVAFGLNADPTATAVVGAGQ